MKDSIPKHLCLPLLLHGIVATLRHCKQGRRPRENATSIMKISGFQTHKVISSPGRACSSCVSPPRYSSCTCCTKDLQTALTIKSNSIQTRPWRSSYCLVFVEMPIQVPSNNTRTSQVIIQQEVSHFYWPIPSFTLNHNRGRSSALVPFSYPQRRNNDIPALITA